MSPRSGAGAAADPRLSEECELSELLAAILEQHPSRDLTELREVTVSTGCFEREDAAVAHLVGLRSVLSEHDIQAQTLIAAFWPGDLAIITPWRDPAVGERHAEVGTPHALVTNDPGILGELATKSRVPIATTTASISVGPGTAGPGPAITVDEVGHFLQTSGMKVAFCVDGGICPAAYHLTVVDCTDEEARVIRTGLVHERAIAAALHEALG